jgi:hypothetical protein
MKEDKNDLKKKIIFYFEPYQPKVDLVGSIARLDDNIDYMKFGKESANQWKDV